MSDLIDRQKAIELFESYIGLTMKADDAHHQILYILSSLPSAEPEERTAKVREGWGLAMCCACEKRVFPYDKYCSHCGARLEWDEDIPMEYFESGGK